MLYVIIGLIFLHIAILFFAPEKILKRFATKFLLVGILLFCVEIYYFEVANLRASLYRSPVRMGIFKHRKKEAPDIFHAIQNYRIDKGVYPVTFKDLEKYENGKSYSLWKNYLISHIDIKQRQCLLLIPDRLSRTDDIFCYFNNELLVLNNCDNGRAPAYKPYTADSKNQR